MVVSESQLCFLFTMTELFLQAVNVNNVSILNMYLYLCLMTILESTGK